MVQKGTLLLLILLLTAQYALTQIIVVEARQLTDTARGLNGNVSLNFNFNSNIVKVLSGGLSSEVSYGWRRNKFISLNNYNVILDVNETQNAAVNQGYQHLRYTHDFNYFLTSAVFAQIQNNPVLRIKERILIGAGPRFNIQPYGTNRLLVGTMLMYEYEDEIDTSAFHRDVRASIFLNYRASISEGVQAGAVTYYQPRLKMLRDFRVSGSFDLSFKVKKNLAWLVLFNMVYDEFPVVDPNIPNLTYSLTNNLTWTF
jgi:hypothetical protein